MSDALCQLDQVHDSLGYQEYDYLSTAGEHSSARLHEMKSRRGSIGDVRGPGLMPGIELVCGDERALDILDDVIRA